MLNLSKCLPQLFAILGLIWFLPPSSRELIAEGQTGGFVIFEDRPNYWDAWGKLPTFLAGPPYG